MRDVKFSDIKVLVEFMYKGEINIDHVSAIIINKWSFCVSYALEENSRSASRIFVPSVKTRKENLRLSIKI